MDSIYSKFKVNVPEGKVGNWEIKRFEVSKREAKFSQLRAILNPLRGDRSVEVGMYTRLTCNGTVVMSDTPAEIRDHLAPIRCAKGKVLINGLGLGVLLNAVLQKPEVEEVIVIELSPEVIELVGDHYIKKANGRLTIIQADALTWKPPKGVRYQMVWHDIWDAICADNLPEIHQLHRRYGRRCDWQWSWCREICESVR